MRCRVILSLACLSILLTSCGSDFIVSTDSCDGRVFVGVTTGPTPEFRWWPDCAVNNLVVLAGVGPHPVGQYSGNWYVESRLDAQQLPKNRLHDGIRYGETPPGAGQVTAAVPLVQGQPYTVYLNAYTSGETVTNVGKATFRP